MELAREKLGSLSQDANLSDANLSGASYNNKTVFPKQFNTLNHDMVFVD